MQSTTKIPQIHSPSHSMRTTTFLTKASSNNPARLSIINPTRLSRNLRFGLPFTYCCLLAVVSRSTTSLIRTSAFSTAFRYSDNSYSASKGVIHHQHNVLPKATFLKKTRTGSTTTRSISTSISNMSNDNDMSFPYVYDGNRAVPSTELPSWMLSQRIRVLTETETVSDDNKNDCVVYWMQRDMRTIDNWALNLAQHYAKKSNLPLRVVHVITTPLPSNDEEDDDDEPPPLEQLRTTERHGRFLLGGLEFVHDELKEKNVPFHIIHNSYDKQHQQHPNVLENFLNEYNPSVVVCDTNVLRHVRRWNESPAVKNALDTINVPLYQVDAHNVVPVWYASPKREVGARTLRPKLHKLVDECLQNKDYKNGSIPTFVGNEHLKNFKEDTNIDFDYQLHEQFLDWDDSVKDVLTKDQKPGTAGGKKQFDDFCNMGLRHFSMLRNDPNNDQISSSLSPWLNHGHLSFATCLRYLKTHNRDAEGKASFIEEGFVRRELSDNFLWYAPDTYDTLEAGAQWAQDSLELHTSDPREYIYKLDEFESGKTHDDLWNAAQIQVMNTGKMHGFLRMYWAKKILEWTSTPADALRYAQYFNDKYALDGRDPNGFCGVAWSIFGNHDMGWKEREIFGKIRFMNYKGCKRKFKVDEFVRKYPPAATNAAIAGNDQTVATQTKKRNKNAAATSASILPAPSQKTTNEPAKKKQKKAAAKVNEEVEDLGDLSKSALSKKTVKVLKAYIESKGVSIKAADGKPLLKAGLIELLMSLSS
jgi:deoxyribodipyrimidine photo-lyase